MPSPTVTSPPANTPGTDVSWTSLTSIQPLSLRNSSMPVQTGVWLMPAMTTVQGTSYSEPATATGRRRPLASGSPSSMRWHFTATARPSLTTTSSGADRNSYDHALVLGLGDLVLDRRHLLAGAPVEQRHVRAEPARGARGVDRGVAAADDDDLVADVDLLADPDALQEVDAGEAVRGILALDAEVDALLGADRQVHGLEVAAQVVHRNVAADLHPEAQLHAEVEDRLDLGVEHLVRQPVARDAVAQHAAALGGALEHRHGVAAARQLVGAGEPGGAAADDRDLLGPLLVGDLAGAQLVL